MPTSTTTQCPYIDRSFTPNPTFNTHITYKCEDETEYIFYEHWDGFDKRYKCQFCKLIGRKRDVFECLNQSEWKECAYYMGRQEK